MIKKFNEIGISVISNLKHKEGDDTLKELLYNINDLLYSVQTRFAVYELAEEVLRQLKEIGLKTKEMTCKDRCLPKKDEILSRIREQCTTLKFYLSNYNVPEDEEKTAIDKMMRFQLSISINTKEAFNNTKDVAPLVKQIRDNKRIFQLLSKRVSKYNINVNQFIKVQNELLNAFVDTYVFLREE